MIDYKALREENQRKQRELQQEIEQRREMREAGHIVVNDWQAPQPPERVLNGDSCLTDSMIARMIDQRIEQLRNEMIDEVADELNQIIDDTSAHVKELFARLTDLEVQAKVRHSEASDEMRGDMNLIKRSLENMEQRINEACSKSEGVLPFVKRVN
jgi:hypothetical protein